MGDRCLMVEFGQHVDPETNLKARAFAERLLAHPIGGVIDVVPAFTSVAVHYRPEAVPDSDSDADQSPYARLSTLIEVALAQASSRSVGTPRVVEVPVCYGGDFGPDLPEIAVACGLTQAQAIELHSSGSHLVYMLGFAPGSPYIGGLDQRLALPRRATPRTKVAAGTVAIAREQSAIYSIEMPGGWNLIGRTPLRLFNLADDPPCLLRPGDCIRFVPISPDRYEVIASQQA
jgi:inhibitor of KinA